jgi:hypothetical protein
MLQDLSRCFVFRPFISIPVHSQFRGPESGETTLLLLFFAVHSCHLLVDTKTHIGSIPPESHKGFLAQVTHFEQFPSRFHGVGVLGRAVERPVKFGGRQVQNTRPLRKSEGYFLRYFSINQAQIGARIGGFRRGQFGAEVLEGGIIARGAQAVNLHCERLGLWIRDEVGLGFEDLTRQASRLILEITCPRPGRRWVAGVIRMAG